MTASFNNVLMIDEHGLLVPAQEQPLTIRTDLGEKTVLRIDAWVLQPGYGFCIASVPGPLTGTKWILDPKPTDYFGNKFKPGSVDAMGLMVTEKENGDKVVFQWSEAKMTLELATG